MSDVEASVTTSLRARPAAGMALPLSPRLRWRLVLATTNALLRPSRSTPVLRRTVLHAAAELHRAGMADDQIRRSFATLIEEVARERGLDGTSLVSGAPRWMQLADRVNEWISIGG